MSNQNEVILSLSNRVRVPNVTRCYQIWWEKWKALSLLLICRMMKSIFIFFPLTKRFQLPILSSWEAQDRSEDPIEKYKKTQKFTSAFVLRADRSKEFFWRQNRWVYPPFNLQVKQTCTLYFCWTQNKRTELSVPLLSLYSHVGGTPVLKKEEVSGTSDLQQGQDLRSSISNNLCRIRCKWDTDVTFRDTQPWTCIWIYTYPHTQPHTLLCPRTHWPSSS